MEATGQTLKQPWIKLFALTIFFFNQLMIVEGMTLTLLLTPLWLFLFFRFEKPHRALAVFILLLLFFAIIHFFQKVHIAYYFISSGILCATALFTSVFYRIINTSAVNFDSILRDILILNFLLVLCAVPLLWLPSAKSVVWYINVISENIKPFPRLKLFTSEASHYSFLFALPAIYFLSRLLFFKTGSPWLTLVMIALPLILSFSLGVLGVLFVSGAIILIIFRKHIFATQGSKRYLGIFALFTIVCLGLSFWLYPDNPLFVRIQNIFSGKDTSARGRTYESFILAHKIISDKSLLWGIGPGQFKIEGRSMVLQFYSYMNIPETVRIPNACGETIVCFGYVGLALRLCTEMFFFFKTQVYKNPFRLWLFLFLFLYQFTGSYITNVNEYILWAVAFSPALFPDFRMIVHRHKMSFA